MNSVKFMTLKISLLALFIIPLKITAQFEFGYTSGFDLYQRYKNPVDDLAYPGAGNAILSLNAGPKLWIGSPKISLSLEAQANLGLLTLSLKDYKGLGSVSFPMLAKLNFNALSGMTKDFGAGWAVGGGIAYTRTELFYLSEKYKDLGVNRTFYPTYIAEINFGGGGYANIGYFYVRYGYHFDTKASVLNIGIMSDKVFSSQRRGGAQPQPMENSSVNFTMY
jgi:hypothetical protein